MVQQRILGIKLALFCLLLTRQRCHAYSSMVAGRTSFAKTSSSLFGTNPPTRRSRPIPWRTTTLASTLAPRTMEDQSEAMRMKSSSYYPSRKESNDSAAAAVHTRNGKSGVFSSLSRLLQRFGFDSKRISGLGVAFALSYTIISNINGAITLSISWYMSCMRVSRKKLTG
jgi:hypothetical protein